jgi:hypothetical protein
MTALRDVAIAFLSVLAVRLVIVQLLPTPLGWKRFAVAYGGLIALVCICLLVLAFSEMPLYGFDNTNPRHVAGYWAMWISVLGAVGIPIAILLDTATALLKGRLRR